MDTIKHLEYFTEHDVFCMLDYYTAPKLANHDLYCFVLDLVENGIENECWLCIEYKRQLEKRYYYVVRDLFEFEEYCGYRLKVNYFIYQHLRCEYDLTYCIEENNREISPNFEEIKNNDVLSVLIKLWRLYLDGTYLHSAKQFRLAKEYRYLPESSTIKKQLKDDTLSYI